MSSPAALSKLQRPLRDLVFGAIQDGAKDLGASEKDQAEVAEWIGKIADGVVGNAEGLKDLDATLTPRTYVVSNYLTAADVALYGALHPTFSQLQPVQYYATPALTRYFDHIQANPVVRKSADALKPAFAAVTLDFSSAPPQERKAPEPKKKEKKEATTAVPPPEQTRESSASASKKERAKKEKTVSAEGASEGKKEKTSKIAPAPAEDAGEPIPSMIDLRVGHILDVKKHPDADGLYQIDFGEETGARTVVSGLVNYIPIEKMQDKWLVGVCNLKPANMRGVKSFAMVLCATSKDGKEAGIEVIDPPPNSKPGDRVYFEGAEFEGKVPLSQLNPKKKIFEAIQPGFITLQSREAAWINPTTKSVHKIRTASGVCTAPTFVGASLS
ncbi:nucleic acid-binding protein [Vararia minispora EC-137]|uniref:Nucleic acid-binding protein n=1 Tax=Vararia minispora EC-137 TaxID=1314806 RepID=A0ACB8QRX6_9AGAM|nr:nucleic acid-binding protein [Vararia minispora EC-137]